MEGSALFDMRERLHYLGGQLEHQSIPGHGTTARIGGACRAVVLREGEHEAVPMSRSQADRPKGEGGTRVEAASRYVWCSQTIIK